MDSSAPNPQPTGLQLAGTRAIETQTEDQQRSAVSSLPLKEVLESLKDEEDGDIFAWLKLARSLPLKSNRTSNLACLTRAQLRGIAILRHCNADDVSALLRRLRTSSANRTIAVSASHPIHEQASDQELEGSSILRDASLSSLFNSPHGGAHQQILTRGPAATVPLVKEKNKYYCTYCDSTKRFEKKNIWRNHELDHLSPYVCMLNGATEDTPQGKRCAFCGELDPSEGHLSTHDAQICRPGSSGPFSCKKNEDMVEHLYNAHHVKTTIAFVHKWKDNVKRQVWSCGFCGVTFGNFQNRCSHVAWHFEQGQTIDEWDTTKVIQGLLLQRGVFEAWEKNMASLPEVEIGCRYWEKHATKALRRDLEVGPNPKKTALDLANAAFAASEFNFDKWAEMLELDLDALTNPDIFDFP